MDIKNDIFAKEQVKTISTNLCKSCLVCGEPVPITDVEYARLMHNMSIEPKICNECKNAILHIRKQLEEN